MNTSPLPSLYADKAVGAGVRPLLVEMSAETSQRDDISTKDQMTSPKSKELVAKSAGADRSQADRSLQTSLAESVKSKKGREDKGQQTSVAEVLDGEMQTGNR